MSPRTPPTSPGPFPGWLIALMVVGFVAVPMIGIVIVAVLQGKPSPVLTDANDPIPLGGSLVDQYPYFGMTVRTYATSAAEDAVVAELDRNLTSLGYSAMPATIPDRFRQWQEKQ